MPEPDDIAAPKSRRPRRTETPPPRVPAVARWALRIGGGFALICGALLSFFALFGLALLNGWPRTVAWALPGCVDVLTATAAVVAMSVPRTHRGARIAHWCAGVSLAITVGCNVEYHALLPAHWTTGHVFLVATGAVPAIVVELIIVMQMYLGDGAALATADPGLTVQPPAAPSTPKPRTTVHQSPVDGQPKHGQPSTPQTGQPAVTVHPSPSTPRSPAPVDDQAPAVQPSMDRWTEIGHPVYVAAREAAGKRPSEGAYRDALAAAAAALIATGELPDCYADPSVSTAKRVRKAVEERFPELSPLHLVTAEAS